MIQGASNANGERVYAPSKMDFPWLNYEVDEMTEADIEQVIHNCNHDLLQQFFSAISNHRTDQWGGSLEKRMAFPLAVQKAVKETITESGKHDFIFGWRISPEEKHSNQVGYDVDNMLAQTKRVFDSGIDYLNISLNLSADYSS